MHIINTVLLIGNVLLLIGLGLATVGGVRLAYDAIHGAGARFQAQVAADQLQNMKTFRAQQQAMIRSFPTPPWTKEERETLLAEEETTYGPQEKVLTEHAGTIEDKYKDRVVAIALRGIFLLIAGFLVQFVGTVMIALESGAVHL